MKKELKFTAQTENIAQAVDFIENALKLTVSEQKTVYKSTLAAEELLVQMIKNADSEQSIVTVQISVGKRRSRIGITCKGAEWKLEDLESLRTGIDISELEDEQAVMISHMLIRALSDDLKLRHSRGINFAQLNIRTAKAEHNKTVLLFMLSGILLGLLLRFLCPDAVCGFVSANIFSVGSTLFMNAVKMIVAPLVFFSIAESMMDFSDFKVFGKISGKILSLYFFTTAVAIGVGYAVFQLIQPGDPARMDAVMAVAGAAETQEAAALSMREILTDIVPKNLTSMFLSDNMLQIIFVAILTGIASSLLGEYSKPVQNFIKAASSLFSRMTNMILKLLPPATLCFMANAVLTTNAASVASLTEVLLVSFIALLVMILVYALLLVIAKINPIRFFDGFKKAMLTAFTTASSSGTMPVSMKALDKMGVSPKIYSFSIPLGATVNMDGASICYVITVLYMMRIFGIQPDGGMLMSLFLSVMLLSIGTPGIPGAAVAMMALLFAQFGIPVGAVGFVVPLIMLLEYARTVANVTGDAVVTMIVAKSEGLLDEARTAKKR